MSMYLETNKKKKIPLLKIQEDSGILALGVHTMFIVQLYTTQDMCPSFEEKHVTVAMTLLESRELRAAVLSHPSSS